MLLAPCCFAHPGPPVLLPLRSSACDPDPTPTPPCTCCTGFTAPSELLSLAGSSSATIVDGRHGPCKRICRQVSTCIIEQGVGDSPRPVRLYKCQVLVLDYQSSATLFSFYTIFIKFSSAPVLLCFLSVVRCFFSWFFLFFGFPVHAYIHSFLLCSFLPPFFSSFCLY